MLILSHAGIPPPSGFDYEAIMRKKRPKKQKGKDEGLNADEMKQLNNIFKKEEHDSDNNSQTTGVQTASAKQTWDMMG